MVRLLHYHPISAAAFVVFALALGKGGPAERGGCLAMIFDWIFESAIDTMPSLRGIAVVSSVALDFTLAVALLLLALRFGKLWLGAAMIIVSVMLALHSMALSDDNPGFYFYAASLNVCTCMIISSLLTGTLSSWRRRTAEHADVLSRHGPLSA